MARKRHQIDLSKKHRPLRLLTLLHCALGMVVPLLALTCSGCGTGRAESSDIQQCAGSADGEVCSAQDEDSRRDKAWQEIAVWLERHGASVDSDFHCDSTMHSGTKIRGVVTDSAKTSGTQILKIPKKLWVSLDNFPTVRDAQLPKRSACSSLDEEDAHVLKSVAMVALESKKGRYSYYGEYFKHVPTWEDYQSFHPRFAHASVIAEFKALPLVKFIETSWQREGASLKKCFKRWSSITESVVSNISWSDMMLAFAHWFTRGYGVGEGQGAMIPALDLLNTEKDSKVNTHWYTTDDEFILEMKDDVRIGEELYDTYCPSCDNSALLFVYGMYMEDNVNILGEDPDSPSSSGPHGGSSHVDCNAGDATNSSLHKITEAILDLGVEGLDAYRRFGWTAPRCRSEVLDLAHGPVRCSLARLAWEHCLHHKQHSRQKRRRRRKR